MYISVIIPTRNRHTSLLRCISSLKSQLIKPDEVLIIDNSASNQESLVFQGIGKEIGLKIRYFHEARKGTSYARNSGINNAKGGILAFIDDDCVADPSWIKLIRKAFRHKDVSVLKGKNINGNANNIFACIEQYTNDRFYEPQIYKMNNKVWISALDSKNFAIKKAALMRNRILFDEIFAPYSMHEDMDLSRQLLEAKIPIYYEPTIVTTHFGRSDFFSHFMREYRKGAALFTFHQKWCNYDKAILHAKNNTLSPEYCILKSLYLKKGKIKAKNNKKLIASILENRSFLFRVLFIFLSSTSDFFATATYKYFKIRTNFTNTISSSRLRLSLVWKRD